MTGPIADTLSGNSTRDIAIQAAFVVFVGGLIAVARKYYDLHLGVPGHTGILWMFFLVSGRGLMARGGAGILMGASAAAWLELFGVKQTLLYNLLLYGLVGAAADVLVGGIHLRLSNPLSGLLTGAIAHASKYGFVLVYALALGLNKNFFLVGTLESLGLHLLFRALGGVAAGVALWFTYRVHPTGRET